MIQREFYDIRFLDGNVLKTYIAKNRGKLLEGCSEKFLQYIENSPNADLNIKINILMTICPSNPPSLRLRVNSDSLILISISEEINCKDNHSNCQLD